jgi:hypothetical protein
MSGGGEDDFLNTGSEATSLAIRIAALSPAVSTSS